jgi:hypothetical protein
MERKEIEARLFGHKLLTEILVDQIPERFFKSSTTTFADFAMGGGQYLAEILRRCEKYHSREQILPRLYGWETNRVYFNRALTTPLREANLFKGLPFEVSMKFDVVIGNPPYQDSSSAAKNVKLWPRFVAHSIESLKDGGFISLITPDSWATFDTSQSRRQRKNIIDNIDLEKVIDENDSFNVGVSIARWFGVKRKYSGKTEAWGQIHDFTSGPCLSAEEHSKEVIYGKIKQFRNLNMRMGNPQISSDLCKEESGTTIRFSGQKQRFTHCEVDDANTPKFVAPFSCSAYSRFFTTDSVGMLNMWMPASEAEAAELSSIWDLKVVRFFIDTYQKTAGFTPAVKNNLIPDLRGMNDQQAFEALSLSKEEIDIIEAHCE